MSIISKLIVKEWFKSLAGAVTVFFLLISTADLINGFLQGKEVSRVLLEYSLKMPDLMGKLFPICCLVATLFSMNKLKSHAELISVLAAGVSYTKLYLLIGTCALTMVGIQFINLGFIEPYANKIKRQEIQKSRISEGKYLTRSSIDGGRFWYKSQNYFASFAYFDRKSNTLKDVELYFFSPMHKSEKFLKAAEAKFIKKDQWEFNKVTVLTNLDNDEFPKEEHFPKETVALGEVPQDFGEFEADLTTLNFFNLREFILRISKTGINVAEYQILLLNKVFLSLICLVFALLPASTIFNPNRRSDSFGKNVVFTLLITVVFWVLYSSAVAFGNSGPLNPWIATGIIPFGFFIFVLRTFQKNQRLSA